MNSFIFFMLSSISPFIRESYFPQLYNLQRTSILFVPLSLQNCAPLPHSFTRRRTAWHPLLYHSFFSFPLHPAPLMPVSLPPTRSSTWGTTHAIPHRHHPLLIASLPFTLYSVISCRSTRVFKDYLFKLHLSNNIHSAALLTLTWPFIFIHTIRSLLIHTALAVHHIFLDSCHHLHPVCSGPPFPEASLIIIN